MLHICHYRGRSVDDDVTFFIERDPHRECISSIFLEQYSYRGADYTNNEYAYKQKKLVGGFLSSIFIVKGSV